MEQPTSPTRILDLLAWIAAHLEHGWTHYSSAKNAMRQDTTPGASDAEAWCLTGAMGAALIELTGAGLVYDREGTAAVLIADWKKDPLIGPVITADTIDSLQAWNDDRTDKRTILRLLSRSAHRLTGK